MLRGQGSARPCPVSRLSSRRLAQSLSHARGKHLGEPGPSGGHETEPASVVEPWDSWGQRAGMALSPPRAPALESAPHYANGTAFSWARTGAPASRGICVELFKPPWMSLHFLSGNALSGCALVFSTSQQSTAGCRLSRSFWSQLSPQGLTK